MKPLVAIIGRPNVGKSTLFNRIIGRQDALVDNTPGVTRDRHYGDATWDGQKFMIVDTGGFISGDDDAFAAHIRFHVEQAVVEAEAVVLVLDGKSGISPFDQDLIGWLRTVQQPVFFVVNKIDGPEQEERLYDFYTLGIESFFPVSAAHGYGVADLLDALVPALSPAVHEEADPHLIRIAVVGRPNVGKSSLVNRLIGQQRLLVSNVPGTTRDAIDTIYEHEDRVYLFIDTAGIRRKAKVGLKLEKFSIIKTLKSLDRCDVALIILDGEQGVTDQDVKVAGYAHERGCSVIFLINKWDLVDKRQITARRFIQDVQEAAKFLSHAPALTISARTGQRVKKLFPLINNVFDQYTTRFNTGVINRMVNDATIRNEPPLHKGRRLKFYYTTQVSVRPPTFVSFVNYPKAVHFSYQRYLINQIRVGTGLNQTPIRLYFRQRSGKLNFKKKKQKK